MTDRWRARAAALFGKKSWSGAAVVLAVGCLLLLLPTGGGGKQERQTEENAQTDSWEVEEWEEKLSNILSRVQGAGEAEVVLTLESSQRQVLAQDSQWDGTGDSQQSTVTISLGGGEEAVVPLETRAPEFRGALVVCPGGDDPAVRLALTQAVSALTGLGSNRISICRMAP